ncbi:MAG: hypothetical protein IJP64_06945 [Oscillospiraceae bacterium]|nr:hypothetical protein [Oscillospiraceae bacterium]
MLIFVNMAIFVCTVLAYLGCFRGEDGVWRAENGLAALRFYTLLSNLFCALAALALALALLGGEVPRWIWLWKYIGAAAVTVTLLTVLVFLAPAAGFKAMFSGRDLYLHLIGPLLAIVSFSFFERFFPLSFPLALTGLIPVILYGLVYLYKVVLCPEAQRWEDFYGYNKNGKWQISFAAMMLGGALVCLALWGLYRL